MKTFLRKVTLEIGLKKGAYVISDLNGKEIVGTFCRKELQKTNSNRN